jgi:predicted peptidase
MIDPPVVVFLHGSGERGDDPSVILQTGLTSALERLEVPALMLFPQCASDFRAFYGTMENRFWKAIDHVVEKYGADANRISVAGYSMGATSSLYLAARRPGTLAAIASIAVGIKWPDAEWPQNLPEDASMRNLFRDMFIAETRAEFIAECVKQVPIWFLHGTRDEACPIADSRALVSELRKVGANPKFTEFENVGHDSQLLALEQEGLFDWLVAHST